MEVSTVILFSLLLCCVSDVQAALGRATLATRIRQNEIEISVWKRSAADLETKMLENFKRLELTLKEELTTTFVPSSIKSLVQQAMADILTEDFIGNMISGHILDEVQSLKANVQNTKTQLKALALQLRHVHQERDNYRHSVRKLRRRLTKNIRALQLQLNQTAASMCDARSTTETTAASTDHSPNNTVPPVTVTTQNSHPEETPSPAKNRDLLSASGDGDLERVKQILAAGNVDINTRGQLTLTPLMKAALYGHRDVMELLVGRGADVSLVNRYGDNILHLACWGGDLETVKLILSLNKVDINARNNGGRTAADRARRRGNQRVLDLLVSRGAN